MRIQLTDTDPVVKRNNSIVRLSDFLFQLIVNGRVTLEASPDIIRRVAEGFEFIDTRDAIEEMLLNKHDVAEFGINKIFMYSYSSRERAFNRIQRMH